jgi:hypothetical protein
MGAPFQRSLDLERFQFDGRQTCIPPLAVSSELLNCGLQRTKRQGRAADSTLYNVLAHLVVNLSQTQVLDFAEGETLRQLGDDRAAGLADRATFTFEGNIVYSVVVTDLDIHGDEVAATGITATELDVGILHAPLVPRILIMIDDVLDVRLTVQSNPFLVARLPADSRGSAKYTSPLKRSDHLLGFICSLDVGTSAKR